MEREIWNTLNMKYLWIPWKINYKEFLCLTLSKTQNWEARGKEKKPQEAMWKEKKKKYPTLISVTTQILSTKMLTSCEGCWIPMTTPMKIHKEKMIEELILQVQRKHYIVFSPLLTVLKEELDADFNELLLKSKFILPATLNTGLKNLWM